MKKRLFMGLIGLAALAACGRQTAFVTDEVVNDIVRQIVAQHAAVDSAVVARGVAQAAALWTADDGSVDDFRAFALANVCPDDTARAALFAQLERIFERCSESADMLTVELLKPTQLTNVPEPGTADYIMGAYSPMAHFSDDMFANKLAFLTIINFPHYTLAEKDAPGTCRTRREWAYARMGDRFTTRVPATVAQAENQAYADAENYIADYNIHMNKLMTDDGRRLWNEPLALLSHWNLRDELKANYAPDALAHERQEMIYCVMQRIVNQTIPQAVVNSDKYDWKPYANVCCADGGEVALAPEPDTRYERILAHFRAYRQADAYCPQAPTAIVRNFDEQMEIPLEQVDSLFRQLLSAPEVAQVGAVIAERLGRPLRPYDIWYDGFKARAALNQDELTEQTRRLYPDAEAFERDMPRLLQRLGFSADEAQRIGSHIVVEPARGSGHAWPALGRNEPARLRTRIGTEGMDYKGYNIAVHEFGHNVEMILDLYDIDYYSLAGVPNTGFTEASAFLFQARDLALLPHGTANATADTHRLQVLDSFWSMYEIMGVSLVDMRMWQWLYAHPDATANELKENTLRIAREVWNAYYAPVLGEPDCTLLAIYSHMVNAPMYLPNYPIGSIVQFQLEQHLATCATAEQWAAEYARIYRQGRLTPNRWMQGAVGRGLSIEPILQAVRSVL